METSKLKTYASQALIGANRDKHALMLDGVRITFRNAEGERVQAAGPGRA